jgi:hypothetical protein
MILQERSLLVNTIVVEEFELRLATKFQESIMNSELSSHAFLPFDESEQQNLGAGFFAKINEREVARVAMFVQNNQVFVGGSADAHVSSNWDLRRALLHAVEDRSKVLGFRSVSLYTAGFAINSIAFYKTLGYFLSGKKKFVRGAALLHMEKFLCD